MPEVNQFLVFILLDEVFRDDAGFAVHEPLRKAVVEAEPLLIVSTGQVGIGIVLLERLLWHIVDYETIFNIRTIKHLIAGINEHLERVIDTVNRDALIECLVFILGQYPPESNAALHSPVKPFVIGHIRAGFVLNLADDAFHDVGCVFVGARIGGMHGGRWAVLSLRVGDLLHLGIEAVCGERGTA